MFFGIGQGLVVILCALFLRAPRKGEVPDVAKAKVQQSSRDFTPLEMLKTPAFWLLYVMMTMLAMGGLMATAQLGPIAVDFKVAKVPVGNVIQAATGSWMPIFILAITFDWIGALLAFLVLKPLRIRWVSAQAGAAGPLATGPAPAPR